ncbi:AraC family transcriptional regulator [Algoriphagus resistens]|uniref:AraC family transcriptional regulator n=1 Tax=Algoriphagus resistens TaxID=1750590 RepID=UPI001E537597|nr:helix-turn-helix domain-containing protein [Algoriphagus resistens]
MKQSAEQVRYKEFLPHSELQPFIYCYWQLNTTNELSEPFTYRVVADGCIDIYFELTNPVESYVMGFCRKFTEFQLDHTFNYVGIRFLPTMFPQFFRIDAKALSDRYEKLQLVVPKIADFISDNFKETHSQEKIKSLLDNYFIGIMAKTQFEKDFRLYGALEVILKNLGVIGVDKDLDVAISNRQLRRIFEYYIGATPKTFSQVVRFQNILKAKPLSKSLRENKLFYDGYFDQSHFIKEFKTFYGVTPSKSFWKIIVSVFYYFTYCCCAIFVPITNREKYENIISRHSTGLLINTCVFANKHTDQKS